MHHEPNFIRRGIGGGAESSAGQQGDNTETTGRLPVVYWGEARREGLTGSGEGSILALDAADNGFDFGIFATGVITGFQVVAEEEGDGLPEIGIDGATVFPDMGEGRVVGFPVYQTDEYASLGDGQAHEGGFEGLHQLGIFVLDDLASLGFFGCLGEFGFDFTNFGSGDAGIGIDLADVVFEADIAPLLAVVAGSMAGGRKGLSLTKVEMGQGVASEDDCPRDAVVLCLRGNGAEE